MMFICVIKQQESFELKNLFAKNKYKQIQNFVIDFVRRLDDRVCYLDSETRVVNKNKRL